MTAARTLKWLGCALAVPAFVGVMARVGQVAYETAPDHALLYAYVLWGAAVVAYAVSWARRRWWPAMPVEVEHTVTEAYEDPHGEGVIVETTGADGAQKLFHFKKGMTAKVTAQ